MKHTPSKCEVEIKGNGISIQSFNFFFGSLHWKGPKMGMSFAHLIAAAPDLLEACEDLVNAMDEAEDHKRNYLQIESIRQAIAKAKGES